MMKCNGWIKIPKRWKPRQVMPTRFIHGGVSCPRIGGILMNPRRILKERLWPFGGNGRRDEAAGRRRRLVEPGRPSKEAAGPRRRRPVGGGGGRSACRWPEPSWKRQGPLWFLPGRTPAHWPDANVSRWALCGWPAALPCLLFSLASRPCLFILELIFVWFRFVFVLVIGNFNEGFLALTVSASHAARAKLFQY